MYTHAVSQQKREANTKVVAILPQRRALKRLSTFLHLASLKRSGPGLEVVPFERVVGGPDRDRTDDLFHAITTIACNL
jgi:hypothetical protein